MIQIIDRKDCFGCSACYNKCPRNFISMVPDEKGFLYPEINEEGCTKCGLCIRVCPVYKNNYDSINRNYKLNKIDIFAAKYKNDLVRQLSASGGVFTALSDYILSQNGIIFGASLEEDFSVCHKEAKTIKERDHLRGSKYVQSNMGNIFKSVEEYLEMGKKILFTGTPCQVAGLYAYIGKYPKNLLTCDLLCHGVPSQKMFNDYVCFLENKYESRLKLYSFRTKEKGKDVYDGFALFTKNVNTDIVEIKSFNYLFLKNYSLRESCFNCRFTNFDRPSDITIGDYVGVQKSFPNFYDKKGISMVLVNTHKGRELFANVKYMLECKNSSKSQCKQNSLNHQVKKNEKSEQFWNDYNNYGYGFIAKKYGRCNTKGVIRNSIKKFAISTGMIRFLRTLKDSY